jgi:hypothetical protein
VPVSVHGAFAPDLCPDIGREAVGYKTGIAKSHRVIPLYDFLNFPTANSLAVFAHQREKAEGQSDESVS